LICSGLVCFNALAQPKNKLHICYIKQIMKMGLLSKNELLAKAVLLLLLIPMLVGCTNDGFDTDSYPQKWQLVKMSGQVPNSEQTGADMAWQEYYIFQNNGSFLKQRVQDGVQYNASGSYTLKTTAEGQFFELIHTADSEIVGSCYGNQNESLWLQSNKQLVGIWQACDGPGLEYRRTQ
jgi:hypothetical protein